MVVARIVEDVTIIPLPSEGTGEVGERIVVFLVQSVLSWHLKNSPKKQGETNIIYTRVLIHERFTVQLRANWYPPHHF